MIDTMKFVVYEMNIFERMNSLDFLFSSKNLKNGKKKLFRWDRNLKVNVYENKITFEGSIPKYLFGNNIQEITLNDLVRFIQIIERKYNISLDKAQITRIDLCTNIETKYPVKYYLDSLISKDRCSVASFTSTKSFSNKSRSIKFYDKKKEVKVNG